MDNWDADSVDLLSGIVSPIFAQGGSTNVISGNLLLAQAGASCFRLYANSELTCRGGVRATKGPIYVVGGTGSRLMFVDQPVTSRVETDSSQHFGFAVMSGRAAFDVEGNSILYLRSGRSNDDYTSVIEFLRSDMFSSTNTTLVAGMYNTSSGVALLPTTKGTQTVEFHSTTQRFARAVAGKRATLIGDEGALLEVYGAQVPDTGEYPHVTEANLYVAAPFTGGLSLSGEGVISIPGGDELRFGSLTVDGAAFSCGRYTYETVPAALKAHLAETAGSIVIGRVGTLFLIQ